MRSNAFVASGVAVSGYPWIGLDHHVDSFNVSYHVLKTGTGDVTYAVEGTLSNASETSAKAFQIVSAKTADFVGNITFPVAAIRLNVGTVSGAGNLSLLTLQAGN